MTIQEGSRVTGNPKTLSRFRGRGKKDEGRVTKIYSNPALTTQLLANVEWDSGLRSIAQVGDLIELSS